MANSPNERPPSAGPPSTEEAERLAERFRPSWEVDAEPQSDAKSSSSPAPALAEPVEAPVALSRMKQTFIGLYPVPIFAPAAPEPAETPLESEPTGAISLGSDSAAQAVAALKKMTLVGIAPPGAIPPAAEPPSGVAEGQPAGELALMQKSALLGSAASEPTVSSDAHDGEEIIWDIAEDRAAVAAPAENAAVEAVWSQKPLIAEPAPLIAEPAPLIAEPAPLIVEPALLIVEPALLIVEPAPLIVEPAPLIAEPAPLIAEPAPLIAEPAPQTSQPTPMAGTPVAVEARLEPVQAVPAQPFKPSGVARPYLPKDGVATPAILVDENVREAGERAAAEEASARRANTVFSTHSATIPGTVRVIPRGAGQPADIEDLSAEFAPRRSKATLLLALVAVLVALAVLALFTSRKTSVQAEGVPMPLPEAQPPKPPKAAELPMSRPPQSEPKPSTLPEALSEAPQPPAPVPPPTTTTTESDLSPERAAKEAKKPAAPVVRAAPRKYAPPKRPASAPAPKSKSVIVRESPF